MGETILVESQLADAVKLIGALDAQGSSPTFAVWYFYDDAQEWKLLLAGPSFDALLRKSELSAYRKVTDEISKLAPSSLAVSDIKLVPSDSPLPKAVRMLIRTDPHGIARAHFTDTTLNGIFLKRMTVLRSV